jgi:drug/metabolite transporter (DMT)-like permease
VTPISDTSVKGERNRLGIVLMLCGMFLFTVNDALGKWLVADYAIGQILAIRSLAALVVLLAIAWRNRKLGDLRKCSQPWLHLLRVILVIAEVVCFYYSVRSLPLADVFMFYLSAPIFVTAMSVLFLGERVGIVRWLAVCIGFGGVVLIFPPSDAALTLPALVALVGSLCLAAILILARFLRGSSGLNLIAYQTAAVAIAGTASIPFGWTMPGGLAFGLMCLLGVVAMTAHFMLNHAVKVAPANVVAPYQYSSIVWAMILGYIIWSDVPAPRAFVGTCLIVAAGLFIFFRENKAKRHSPMRSSPVA